MFYACNDSWTTGSYEKGRWKGYFGGSAREQEIDLIDGCDFMRGYFLEGVVVRFLGLFLPHILGHYVAHKIVVVRLLTRLGKLCL